MLKKDWCSAKCFENMQMAVFSDDREAVPLTVFPWKCAVLIRPWQCRAFSGRWGHPIANGGCAELLGVHATTECMQRHSEVILKGLQDQFFKDISGGFWF